MAVVVLLCVVAMVALTLALGGDDDAGAADTPVPGECAAPPVPPAAPQTYDEAPDPAIAEDAVWEATVTTNCGDIVLELDGKKAPQTVASFISLSGDGYYDASPCHRLTTGNIFVLQCGDPTGTGSGNPGYGFGIENAPPDGAYPTGTLAMARGTDPNSNGSQFFIVYDDTMLPTEGGGYSIFGKVTAGLDIVEKIAEQGVADGAGDGAPAKPISILEVSVEKV